MTATNADELLAHALAELAAAPSRVYFDEPADASARTVYYSSISATDPPQLLRSALARLVTTTNTNWPSYNPARNVYPWVDLQRNLKLVSIYTGDEYDPETFIRQDIATLAQEQASQIESREFAAAYNCEHAVPQSWFGKAEPLRGDLHHLFACESRCNSFRGNALYHDFPEASEVDRDRCGRREAIGFEPHRGKAAVARATLYVLLRHADLVAGRYAGPDMDVLCSWHDASAPTEWEHHRNQAIFEAQGNRNPFIDFPDMARCMRSASPLASSTGAPRDPVEEAAGPKVPPRTQIESGLKAGFNAGNRPDLAGIVGTADFTTWINRESRWNPWAISPRSNGGMVNGGLFQFWYGHAWAQRFFTKGNDPSGYFNMSSREQALAVVQHFHLAPAEVHTYANQIRHGTYHGWG